MIAVRRFEAEKPEAIENQLLELLKVCFEKELKVISDERLIHTGIRQNGWFVALDEKTNEVFGSAQIIRDQRIANVCTVPKYRRRGIAEGLMKLIIADIEARGFEPHLGAVNSEMVRYYRKFGFACVGETLEMRKGLSPRSEFSLEPSSAAVLTGRAQPSQLLSVAEG